MLTCTLPVAFHFNKRQNPPCKNTNNCTVRAFLIHSEVVQNVHLTWFSFAFVDVTSYIEVVVLDHQQCKQAL